MNYRHAFHAGNHADVLKHIVLARVLTYLTQKDKPLMVLDAHAGIGRYDLTSIEAQKTGEYHQGIAKLLVGPRDSAVTELLQPYLSVISKLNSGDRLRYYPGSPEIAAQLTRPFDRLLFNELHPVDAETLKSNFGADRRVRISQVDAQQAIKASLPCPEKRALVLIDPAFEVIDETDRVLRMIDHALRRMAQTVLLIWYPIKTKEFSASLHSAIATITKKPSLAIELSVKEPFAEGGLAGSGLVVINPPHTLEKEMAVLLPTLQHALATAVWGRATQNWITQKL